MLSAGGGDYIDYLAFHYYAANNHWPNIIAKTAELLALAQSNGFYKPVVCIETGLTSSSDRAFAIPGWGPSNEEVQSRYLAQSFVQASAAFLPGIYWFTSRDWGNSSGTLAAFQEAGLLTADGAAKPAYNAYRTVKQELGDGAYIRRTTASEVGSDQVDGFVFQGATHPVWVLWTQPSATDPITVSLDSGTVVRVVDMYGAVQPTSSDGNGHAQISLTHNPVYVELNTLQLFGDVSPSLFAYQAILYLITHGVVSGYADGSFRPFNFTTRSQLAKIVVLGAGWDIDTSGGPHFSDVSPDNPFYAYVETAYHHLAISGYGDGTFRPFANITRGQLTKIAVVAAGWERLTPAQPTFTDVPSSNPFYTFIETAVAHGVVGGYTQPDGTRQFLWSGNATRAQIAKIEYLILTLP